MVLQVDTHELRAQASSVRSMSHELLGARRSVLEAVHGISGECGHAEVESGLVDFAAFWGPTIALAGEAADTLADTMRSAATAFERTDQEGSHVRPHGPVVL